MNKADKFTLIELLVVIAIISILMTILLPALKNAKEYANASICASNMKQIHLATTNYINDYDEYIPACGERRFYWIKSLLGYLNDKKAHIESGFLVGWSKKDSPVHCPSTKIPPQGKAWDGSSYNPVTNYLCSSYGPTVSYDLPSEVASKNSWGGWQYVYCKSATETNRGSAISKKLRQIKDQSVILIEKSFYTLSADYVMPHQYSRPQFTTPTFYHSDPKYAPAWRHNNRSNFLFKDGHVSSIILGNKTFNADWQVK